MSSFGARAHHAPSGFEYRRRQDSCLPCDQSPAPCSCKDGQQCVLISRTCNQCPYNTCIGSPSDGGGGGGISGGAVGGVVIAALAALAAVLGYLFWQRRRRAQRKAAEAAAAVTESEKIRAAAIRASKALSTQPPSPGAGGLQVRTPMSDRSRNSTVQIHNAKHINLDPRTAAAAGAGAGADDPFGDSHSVSSTFRSSLTRSTNVIPIAYVSPDSKSPSVQDGNGAGGAGGAGPFGNLFERFQVNDRGNVVDTGPVKPHRPPRSPDLDIRINDRGKGASGSGGGGGPLYAQTNGHLSVFPHPPPPIPEEPSGARRLSDVSAFSSISNTSFLNDAPVIVTPTAGGIRKVQIGAGTKAEVVRMGSLSRKPGGGAPSSPNPTSGPSVRSPLSQSSVAGDDLERDPFHDSPTSESSDPRMRFPLPPSPSSSGGGSSFQGTIHTGGVSSKVAHPTAAADDRLSVSISFISAAGDGRPDSLHTARSTTTQSFVSARSATTPTPTPASAPAPSHDPSSAAPHSLWQQLASEEASSERFSLPGPGLPNRDRFSSASALSSTSSLGGIPFVGVSRPGAPIRSASADAAEQLPRRATNPSRNTLALSTISTASSAGGLGGYDFRLDADAPPPPPLPERPVLDAEEEGEEVISSPTTTTQQGQKGGQVGVGGGGGSRDSFETLALSRELASFPFEALSGAGGQGSDR